jgi:hypothetical protein
VPATVTYESGKGRQDVWSKRTWEASEEEIEARKNVGEELVKYSPKQARELEKSLDISENSGIMNTEPTAKISMQYFAKKSEDFATVVLPKDEYAHVMSEIATNISDEQKNKKVFKKLIGNNEYTVENKGFGNYRIIGRKEIK